MREHVKAVAWLQIGLSIIGVLIAFTIALLLWGIGLSIHDHTAEMIISIIAPMIAVFAAVTALPSIIGGIFLLKYKEWSRILVIIVSFIDLICFPIGTAVGVYSLWVLLNDDTIKLFIEQPNQPNTAESMNN
ncbi:MAG: hypothetical protein GY855_13195 [candidate division Zixibacteria bacterium]|nr:hypothetical protein [candidate division Zixibacteria bacterium]